MRSNGGAWYRSGLALANGFALVNGAGPADAGVDARLQPSRVAHNASARRRSGSRIGMPPNVQQAEQHPARRGDVPHRSVERGLIGLRGSVEPADLAHELQRRVVQLRVGRRMIRVSQALDVSAHDVRPFVIYWDARSGFAPEPRRQDETHGHGARKYPGGDKKVLPTQDRDANRANRQRPPDDGEGHQAIPGQAAELPGEDRREQEEDRHKKPETREEVPVGPTEPLHIEPSRTHRSYHGVRAPAGIHPAEPEMVSEREQHQQTR